MTLQERIEMCRALAYSSSAQDRMEAYVAEEFGLRGKAATAWITAGEELIAAYELGRRDRATLLRLEE